MAFRAASIAVARTMRQNARRVKAKAAARRARARAMAKEVKAVIPSTPSMRAGTGTTPGQKE
eukprot:14022367-Heterocapsa_arctica.AAC.1